jgi:hypothetical protein
MVFGRFAQMIVSDFLVHESKQPLAPVAMQKQQLIIINFELVVTFGRFVSRLDLQFAFGKVSLRYDFVGVGFFLIGGVSGVVGDAFHFVFHFIVVNNSQATDDAHQVVPAFSLDFASQQVNQSLLEVCELKVWSDYVAAVSDNAYKCLKSQDPFL